MCVMSVMHRSTRSIYFMLNLILLISCCKMGMAWIERIHSGSWVFLFKGCHRTTNENCPNTCNNRTYFCIPKICFYVLNTANVRLSLLWGSYKQTLVVHACRGFLHSCLKNITFCYYKYTSFFLHGVGGAISAGNQLYRGTCNVSKWFLKWISWERWEISTAVRRDLQRSNNIVICADKSRLTVIESHLQNIAPQSSKCRRCFFGTNLVIISHTKQGYIERNCSLHF